MSFEIKVLCYWLFILGALVAIFLFKRRISQWKEYYNFADKRNILGIPNFMDVVTNIPFIFCGLYGVIQCASFSDDMYLYYWERIVWITMYFSVFTVGFTSSYFHLWPNDDTLFWDRFSMGFILGCFFSLLILERFVIRFPWMIILFPILNIVSAGSVVQWIVTEKMGVGDLRLYGWVQFAPIISMPILFIVFPIEQRNAWPVWGLEILYGIAKVHETLDHQIFKWTGERISGHSLKHIWACVALVVYIEYVRTTKVLADE